MKQAWTRFGIGLLCLLLLVIFFKTPLRAEAEEVATQEIETDEWGTYLFSSYDELKELASRTYTDYSSANYVGAEPLIIESDLVIPENLELHSYEGQNVVVPQDVTFSAGSICFDHFTVEGTANCEHIYAFQSLTIRGTLNISIGISVNQDTELTGEENISYKYDWSTIDRRYEITDNNVLKEAVATASTSENPRWRFGLWFGSQQMYIEESITIPGNCHIESHYQGMPIVINPGCAIKIECDAVIELPITVRGTLENNNRIVVHYDFGGSITFADGGQYAGTGDILVRTDSSALLQEMISGLDLTEMEVVENNDDWGHWWNIRIPDTSSSETAYTRIYGSDRFQTAFATADALKAKLGVEKFDSVVVANGANFADALSGSYLAAVKNAPILLSFSTDAVNNEVKSYIRENLNPGGMIYILGGEAAVPTSMETGLDSFSVKRLAGQNRFDTNLEILKEAGIGDKPVLVCTGINFADSLSASATKYPVLLVGGNLTGAQKALLEELNGNKLYVIGGEAAVPAQMEQQMCSYGVVVRVAGSDRFETSVAIAETFFESPAAVVLAYAMNFPDGLCGGPLATAMDAPLILTADGFEADAAAYVQSGNIINGTILGGSGLISNSAANNIFR